MFLLLCSKSGIGMPATRSLLQQPDPGWSWGRQGRRGRLWWVPVCLPLVCPAGCSRGTTPSRCTTCSAACPTHGPLNVATARPAAADLLAGTPMKSQPADQQLSSPRFELQVGRGGRPLAFIRNSGRGAGNQACRCRHYHQMSAAPKPGRPTPALAHAAAPSSAALQSPKFPLFQPSPKKPLDALRSPPSGATPHADAPHGGAAAVAKCTLPMRFGPCPSALLHYSPPATAAIALI